MGLPRGHAPRPVAAQKDLFFRNDSQCWGGQLLGETFSLLFACFLVGTGQLFVQNRKKTTRRWINQIARNGHRVLRILSVTDTGKCEEIIPQMFQILVTSF